jgi:catechol 2,3-dioxygenase-like lactoylglutathione lyase family enzyme
MPKLHVSLNVADVAASVEFYRKFFGAEPVKLKADYAKFDLAEPSVNFTLNQVPSMPGGTLNHLGIQVESTEVVLAARKRLQEAGLLTEDEMQTDCCYAFQDKIWVSDPDGHRWEVFHVLVADTDNRNEAAGCCQPASEPTPVSACCQPASETPSALPCC